jgi:acetoacetyl-CoA reductase
VVTGGIGGLGTAMCKALVAQGRTVVATYYPSQEELAREWQGSRRAEGFAIRIYPVDITDFDSCTELATQVETEVGSVDILVNNAGITRDAVLKRMEKAQWDIVIATNLSSVFNLTRQVFGGMLERKWGRIVNISSMNGQKGQYGQANYAAAKAGIHGFTLSIAAEGARYGVTVNTISPGYIGTDMVRSMPEDVLNKIITTIPVGRLGTPEDVARAVVFLTAEEAGYITGANLAVNGGSYFH